MMIATPSSTQVLDSKSVLAAMEQSLAMIQFDPGLMQRCATARA